MVMAFDTLDPILNAWAITHTLHMITQDRDDSVRSVSMVNALGNKCQIWLDQNKNGVWLVKVWDMRKKSETLPIAADLSNAYEQLEDAYLRAMQWLK
jgi:hypothetical protein